MEATFEGSIRFSERDLKEPASIAPIFDGLTRSLPPRSFVAETFPFSFLRPGEEDLTRRGLGVTPC